MAKDPNHPRQVWDGPPPEVGTPEWLDLVRALEEYHGRKICASHQEPGVGPKRRDGFPCEGHVVTEPGKAGKRCRMHGGTQPVGVANVNYQHGRTSRYALAGRLGEAYQGHLADMDYISLRDDLAANAALLQEAWDTICSEPPEPLDPVVFDKEEVKARQQQIAAWHMRRAAAIGLYRDLTQDRNRLSRTEIARVRLAEDTISGQQVRAFAQVVLDATRRRVLELAQQQGVAYDRALACVSEIQGDVFQAIEASRRASGANDVPADFQLIAG